MPERSELYRIMEDAPELEAQRGHFLWIAGEDIVVMHRHPRSMLTPEARAKLVPYGPEGGAHA